MKIPEQILEVLTDDEAKRLVSFYGTDFYQVYLDKLKHKYRLLFEHLD